MAADNEQKESIALRAYEAIRQKILRFELLPAEKLHEVSLAEQLSISRTPLREALNRLEAEGLLIAGSRGFSVPDLEPNTVRDLFEARTEIECSTVRLACERAPDAGLAALSEFLVGSVAASEDASIDHLVKLDTHFHEAIAILSGNKQLLRILRNLNDRIHLIRWIAMKGKRSITQKEHQMILKALRLRDAPKAEALMRAHILHRHSEVLAAIGNAYAHVHTAHFRGTEGSATREVIAD